MGSKTGVLSRDTCHRNANTFRKICAIKKVTGHRSTSHNKKLVRGGRAENVRRSFAADLERQKDHQRRGRLPVVQRLACALGKRPRHGILSPLRATSASGYRGSRLRIQLVSAGEAPLTIAYGSHATDYMSKGAPIGWVAARAGCVQRQFDQLGEARATP